MNIAKNTTPNKTIGRGGVVPDIIVDHITEGTYSSAVNWLCNPAAKASAHFVVARDGRVAQLVDITDTAWANGTSTDPSSKVYFLNSKSAIVRQRVKNTNSYTVSIEHEGIYLQTHGALTDAQLAATIELHKHIRSEIKRIYGKDMPVDKDHIIGHCVIAPVTKPNCPGELYPFAKIIAAMQGNAVASAPTVSATKTDTGILYIQKTLNRLNVPDVALVEDGINGAKTKAAVVKFQGIVNINTDGIAGSVTQNALNDILLKPLMSMSNYNRNATRYLQYRLGIIKDGIYGTTTMSYVKSYQSKNKLAADGIIGPKTWAALIN